MEFGVVLNLALSVLAFLFYYKGEERFWYFLIGAIFIDAILVIKPEILKIFYKVWMKIAVVMGFFMTKILLGALFFICILPIALLKKHGSKKALELGFNKELNSYWTKKYGGRDARKQY